MPFSLMDNTSWAAASTAQAGAIQENGTRFKVDQACNVTHLRWYRHTTVAGNKPTFLHLWQHGNTVYLVQTTVPDNGAIGWQSLQLTTPIALTPGTVYIAAASFQTNVPFAVLTRGAVSNPDLPAAWDANIAAWHYGNGIYPESVGNGAAYGLDCTLDAVGGGSIELPPDLVTTNDLADWFDPSDATKPSSDPKLYPRAVAHIESRIDTIPGLGDDPWDVIQRLWQFAGDLTEAERALWNAFAKNAAVRLTGGSGGGGSAFYGPGGTQVADAAEDTLAEVREIRTIVDAMYALVQNIYLNTQPPPAEGWTLVGEQAFDTWLYWPQAANYYLVHFDFVGSHAPGDTPVGIEYFPRLAWWCPHDGAGGQERQFIDFRDTYLSDRGRLMPGVLLHSPFAATGTIQAYTV